MAEETLLDYLESFNRKERFFLVGHVLGDPKFTLGAEFCAELERSLSKANFPGLVVPRDSYVAMDYHFDWLHAALLLSRGLAEATTHRNESPKVSTGNQEDVDLLVAFEVGATVHLLLIEAKGDSPWSNKQTRSKVDRLRVIFGDDPGDFGAVTPHFLLMSPTPPSSRLDTRSWSEWMLPNGEPQWLKLEMPQHRRRIIGSDSNGSNSSARTHFRITRST